MCKRNKGFTLVETLIALALLGIVMLFVSQIVAAVSDISYSVDTTIQDTTDPIYVLGSLQEIFMQSKQIKQADDRLIVVTESEEIPIYISRGNLFIKDCSISELVTGNIQATEDSVTFNLVLANKSIIQTTFYLAEGGAF